MKKTDSETITLRIISGSLRSRKIQFACDRRTRPMKDRTREAVLNLLGGTLEGTLAFDLFGGSGVLAFEAISRGSHAAAIWEVLRHGAATIQAIANQLGIANQTRVLHEDSFRWGQNLRENWGQLGPLFQAAHPSEPTSQTETAEPQPQGLPWPQDRPWVVFCCPPYSMWETQGDALKSLIQQWWQAAPEDSLFAVELETETPVSWLPEEIDWDIRNYQPAKIAVAQKETIKG